MRLAGTGRFCQIKEGGEGVKGTLNSMNTSTWNERPTMLSMLLNLLGQAGWVRVQPVSKKGKRERERGWMERRRERYEQQIELQLLK